MALVTPKKKTFSGINTSLNPVLIGETQSPDAKNFITDVKNGSLHKRKGFTRDNDASLLITNTGARLVSITVDGRYLVYYADDEATEIASMFEFAPLDVNAASVESDYTVQLPSMVGDTFDGASLDTDIWVLKESPVTRGTVFSQNNELIWYNPDTNNNTPYSFIHSKYPVYGDFDVQVDFSSLDLAVEEAFTVGIFSVMDWPYLFSAGGSLNGYDIYIGRVRAEDLPGQTELVGYAFVEHGDTVSGGAEFVSSSDTSGKLRISKSGTTITGYYWTGAAWQEITNYTDAGTSAKTVNIGIYSGGQIWENWGCNFDNFVVTAG